MEGGDALPLWLSSSSDLALNSRPSKLRPSSADGPFRRVARRVGRDGVARGPPGVRAAPTERQVEVHHHRLAHTARTCAGLTAKGTLATNTENVSCTGGAGGTWTDSSSDESCASGFDSCRQRSAKPLI